VWVGVVPEQHATATAVGARSTRTLHLEELYKVRSRVNQDAALGGLEVSDIEDPTLEIMGEAEMMISRGHSQPEASDTSSLPTLYEAITK
jgi:hypothetical protein